MLSDIHQKCALSFASREMHFLPCEKMQGRLCPMMIKYNLAKGSVGL
jgi:hypothetical protein